MYFILLATEYLPIRSMYMVCLGVERRNFPAYQMLRSQTSWIWLETKLVELEMVGASKNYQVCSFVLRSVQYLIQLIRYLSVGLPIPLLCDAHGV